MKRTARILVVTAGLFAGGALFGAASAVASLLIGTALRGNLQDAFAHGAVGFVAVVGAVFGMALFPAAAWLLMRRVPVGLALAGTGAGTVAGGVLGWLIPANDAFLISVGPVSGPDQAVDAVTGAVIGFVLSIVFLRIATARAARRRAAGVAVT
ncbi:MAG TPA: hypothetical protein VF092_13235 [Longimicrobium sp.]